MIRVRISVRSHPIDLHRSTRFLIAGALLIASRGIVSAGHPAIAGPPGTAAGHPVSVVPRPSAATSPKDAGAPIERWDWTGSVPAGRVLRVDNLFGDVRARFGGTEGKVEVHAVLQNIDPSTKPLHVSVDGKSGALIVAVGPSDGKPPAAAPAGGEGRPNRVDLSIFVPEGTKLSVSTKGGLIEIRGLRGAIEASTESGAIDIRQADGAVLVRNDRGTTSVVLARLSPDRTYSVESVTGDITVSLPDPADATVKMATSGYVTTDVTLAIEKRPHEEPNKVARALLGAGTVPVSIRSRRGAIRLLQQEDFREPLPPGTGAAASGTPAPTPGR